MSFRNVSGNCQTNEHDSPVQSGLTLQVPPDELAGLRDFDVYIVLRSTSGNEGGAKVYAAARNLKIRAKAK